MKMYSATAYLPSRSSCAFSPVLQLLLPAVGRTFFARLPRPNSHVCSSWNGTSAQRDGEADRGGIREREKKKHLQRSFSFALRDCFCTLLTVIRRLGAGSWHQTGAHHHSPIRFVTNERKTLCWPIKWGRDVSVSAGGRAGPPSFCREKWQKSRLSTCRKEEERRRSGGISLSVLPIAVFHSASEAGRRGCLQPATYIAALCKRLELLSLLAASFPFLHRQPATSLGPSIQWPAKAAS